MYPFSTSALQEWTTLHKTENLVYKANARILDTAPTYDKSENKNTAALKQQETLRFTILRVLHQGHGKILTVGVRKPSKIAWLLGGNATPITAQRWGGGGARRRKKGG